MIINWLAEYLFSFVEVLMSCIFCEAFFEKRPRASKLSYIVISLVLAVIVIALNSVKLFSLINTVIFFVLFCLADIFLFKANIIKIIGVELTYFALLFLLGTFTQTIAAQLAGTSTDNLTNNFSDARIISGIFSKLILSAVCMGINRLTAKNKIFDRKAFALGFFGTIILIVLSAVIYNELAAHKEENDMIGLLFFLMLALLFSTFIAFIFFWDSQQKKQENELIRRQNQYLERSLTEQENTFFLWRQSIHDYKNSILMLDSYIEQNRLSELADYIHCEKIKFEQSTPFFKTGNSTVDTIINTKYATSRQKDIPFSVNAKVPEKCTVSDIHLAVILGNLLDNAIEAQANEKDPFIRVQFITIGEMIIIKVENKCSLPPESSDTTKKNRQFHGIGLKSVKKTAEQYGGDFSLKYENDTAVATVIIPNNIYSNV